MSATRAPNPGRARLKRPAKFAAAILASVLAIAGCGSSHRAAATVSQPDTIVIQNFAFEPSTLVVPPGARVTVHNADQASHTVDATDKAFDTGEIGPGATVTFTAPKTAGSYAYICQNHQFMHGMLEVR